MSKRALWVGTWICFLFLTFLPAAYADISNIVPAEGTVGTQLVVSGSGFGTKHGEVLLGEEECKVLSWSNTEILCEVNKPQPAGLYAVTVIPRKGQSLTFEAFAMRRPQLLAKDWVWDGKTLTLAAKFLGDKKGDIFFVVQDEQGGTPEVFDAKAVHWSMDTVRFKIPPGLSGYSGDNIFVVAANQVGRGSLFVSLSGGMPMVTTDNLLNFGLSHDNVSGVQVDFLNVANLHFGAFYPCAEAACNHDNEILARSVYNRPYITSWYLDSDDFSDITNVSTPVNQTDAAVVPLRIKDKMWLFFSGQDDGLYFTWYDGTQWKSGSERIELSNVLTNADWEIAPVYNPTTHRIEVYHEYYQKLYRVYSDDYGATWVDAGQVTGINVGGVTTITQAPSAVFNSQTNSVLLAVGISNQAYVFSIQNGVVVGTPRGFGSVAGRPFVGELSSTYLALAWHTENGGVPYISKMNKSTGVWEKAYHPIPDQGSEYAPSFAVWGSQGYLMWGNKVTFGTYAIMEAFY